MGCEIKRFLGTEEHKVALAGFYLQLKYPRRSISTPLSSGHGSEAVIFANCSESGAKDGSPVTWWHSINLIPHYFQREISTTRFFLPDFSTVDELSASRAE